MAPKSFPVSQGHTDFFAVGGILLGLECRLAFPLPDTPAMYSNYVLINFLPRGNSGVSRRNKTAG